MTMKAHIHIRAWLGLLAAVAVLLTNSLHAQPNETLEAYRAYQQQDFIKAAQLIDRAIEHEEGKNNAMTWHIRGFVYKDLYNESGQRQTNTEYREKAVTSYLRSIELDDQREYLENNKKSLRYLASSIYNDAVLIMREVDAETIEDAKHLYNSYKNVMSESGQSFDEKDRDVTFYKALATCYRKIYEQNREQNSAFLQKALDSYQLVLSLDPENYGANYNTAINLYNEGAFGIEQIDTEAQIPTIVKVQAESVELFREALPYLLKAYEIDPTRRETLIALRGVYLSLNNNEEANKYRDLLRETQQTNK